MRCIVNLRAYYEDLWVYRLHSRIHSMDLVTLLHSEESKTLEFKANTGPKEGILKTIVAFANTSGGRLLIGVEDQSKRVCGVEFPKKEEEKLSNLISDSISPNLVPSIEIISFRKLSLISIRVFPSNTRPHFIRSLGDKKGVYIRIGSTNRPADDSQINALKRYTKVETFDEEAMEQYGENEIDFERATIIFKNDRKLEKKDLETLKLVTEFQGKLVPTVAGILLFGRNHLKSFPTAWIKAGRFKGNDRSTILDSKDIKEILPILPGLGMEFVKKHAELSYHINGIRREEKWSIPIVAVREALINAIVHADYSQNGSPIKLAIFDDRIEIESPGIIPYGMTLEDMYKGVSKLRNPIIGRVFNELKFVEQWGSGIQRILSDCKEVGLRSPVFEEVGTHFRVTIFIENFIEPQLDDTNAKIIEMLTNNNLSTSEIARQINLSTRATRTRMTKLVNLGVVYESGLNARDPQKKYLLANKENLFKKEVREPKELLEFGKYLYHDQGVEIDVVEKSECPDYICVGKSGEKYYIELVSVYLTDKCVEERKAQIKGGLQYIPENDEKINQLKKRIVNTITDKVEKTQHYSSESLENLYLSIYVNAYESIYLETCDYEHIRDSIKNIKPYKRIYINRPHSPEVPYFVIK